MPFYEHIYEQPLIRYVRFDDSGNLKGSQRGDGESKETHEDIREGHVHLGKPGSPKLSQELKRLISAQCHSLNCHCQGIL